MLGVIQSMDASQCLPHSTEELSGTSLSEIWRLAACSTLSHVILVLFHVSISFGKKRLDLPAHLRLAQLACTAQAHESRALHGLQSGGQAPQGMQRLWGKAKYDPPAARGVISRRVLQKPTKRRNNCKHSMSQIAACGHRKHTDGSMSKPSTYQGRSPGASPADPRGQSAMLPG